MNSNSAVATTASAISGAMLGGVIVWICGLFHIEAPPPDVAGTIGAVLLGGGHAVVNWLSARFPIKPTVTSVPVAVQAAPVAVPVVTQPATV